MESPIAIDIDLQTAPSPESQEAPNRVSRSWRTIHVLHAAMMVGAASGVAYFGWQKFGPDFSSPRIAVTPATVDFGAKAPGEEATVQFTVANRGWSPLKIAGFRTSCTCSVATVEKPELLPGESTPITVKIRIDSHSGDIRRAVQVSSNDPRNPTVVFAATGRVVTPKSGPAAESQNKSTAQR